MRRASLLIAIILAGLVLPACTKRNDATADLLAILNRAATRSYSVHYVEKIGSRTAVVDTAVDDDLRYTANLSIDGAPVAAEVVRDDARALRFINYDQAALIYTARAAAHGPSTSVPGPPSPSPSPSPSAAAPSPTSTPGTGQPGTNPSSGLDQLRSGDWVVDPVGASDLTNTQSVTSTVGADPVLDALTVFRYVESAINDAGGVGASAVEKFNPESTTYNPKFDPFPAPDKSAGEVRYDVVPPELPPRDASVTSISELEAALPGPSYFRHLSVYVRNGLPVRVLESISIERRLSDPNNDLLARLGDLGTKISANLPLHERAALVLAALKKYEKNRPQADTQEIRPRELHVDLTGIGATVAVAIPDGAATGTFGSNLARGQVLQQGS